jgi:phosphoserine phosphatase RsbU/P
MTDLRDRYEAFAARLTDRIQAKATPRIEEAWSRATGRLDEARKSAQHGRARPAFREDYWQAVRELFTRDVTGHDLHQMVREDAGETLRFFAREVDFQSLQSLPLWKRYPTVLWKMFLAMAYRLSPPRRLLFAIGVPVLVLGWLHYAVVTFGSLFLGRAIGMFTGWEWWLLLAGTLLLALLLLELRDKLSLKGDLEVARQIQFGLLPFEPYAREGLRIRASMRPANTVGGDYFDVIDLAGEGVAFAVGDVAGKGMPAALLMALLQGSLRTLLTAGLRGSEAVAKLNAHLYANIPANRLVTFFYGEIDPASGALRYVNAGHNPPFLMRARGGVERLEPGSIALGVLGDADFATHQACLEPGDRIFLYTDGVTEANDAKDAEYGDVRLAALLHARRESSDEELLEAVRRDVLAFCDTVRPRDDMTMMLVRRQA